MYESNKINILTSTVMILWGSIGLFTRYIGLAPIQLAFSRAALAALLLVIMSDRKNWSVRKFNRTSVVMYIMSGALIGMAWVALFYGYTHTTIASAVIIYNMCPVYVMLAAPIVLKEKRSHVQTGVIIVSIIGLVLIVGAPGVGENDLMGKIMSGISGLLYAVIVIMNRKIKAKLSGTIATAIQMMGASLVLLPFVLNAGFVSAVAALDKSAIVLTVVLGIVHTGVAYSLYFSTYHQMKSIDIVVYSYLEPVFGLLFGVVFLKEPLTRWQLAGGLLILGSTFIGENIQAGRFTLGRPKTKLSKSYEE